MKRFGSARWWKKIKAAAVASAVIVPGSFAIALSAPVTAVAQSNTTDQNFLNDLHNFLQTQDMLSHQIAVGMETDVNALSSIDLAQSVCFHISENGSIQEMYGIFMSGVMNRVRDAVDPSSYADIEYSAGLYFGSVMNLGAAYYCPEYQEEVIQVLNTL